MKHKLTMIYQTIRKGIFNSQKSKEWLASREIDIQKIPVGYNSGVLHKNKTSEELEELESLGLIHSPDALGRYKIFGKGMLFFPIRDRHDSVINYHAYDTQSGERTKLNQEFGYYPFYPKTSTKQLFLCFDLLETAKMASSPLAESLGLTHLNDGKFEDHHAHLFDQLPHLQEIIVPGFLEPEQIKKLQETILEKRPDVTLIYAGEPEESTGQCIIPLEQINPGLFHAENEEYSCDIIGGEFHPDKEITLKLSRKNEQKHFRDTILLYSNTQRRFFIEEAVRYLNTDEQALETFLDELTESLEAFAKNEGKSTLRANDVEISDTDRQKGLKELSKEKIPEIIQNELLDKVGIVGETNNRMIMWLAMLSRKLTHPLHIACYGDSGTGKSMLQESVARCFDESECIELTSASDKSMYYLQDSLSQKVLLIQDMYSLSDEVVFQLREMMSKKQLTRTVTIKDKDKGFLTELKTMKASVSVIACTTENAIYHDNATRSIELRIDSSDEQDSKVLRRQQMMAARTIEYQVEAESRKLLQIIDKLVLPYKVVNPYAMELNIPKSVFSKRRTMGMYLGIIEAVTLLNQYKRKRKTENETEYLLTDIQDIEFANHLMMAILLQKSDSLNQGQRHFFEALKNYVLESKKQVFTQKMLVHSLRLHPSKVKRYVSQLTTYGYISISGGDRYKKGFTYSISETNDYQKLQTEIKSTLNQNLERAKRIRITT